MPEEELKIPEQHAAETGNFVKAPGLANASEPTVSFSRGGSSVVITGAPTFSMLHNAAANLHGWGQRVNGEDEPWGHRHHAGEPLKLSRADYVKALEAASKTNELGEYEPHLPAMSEHCEHREHHKRSAERAKAHREEKAKAEKAASEKPSKRASTPETTEAAKV